MPARARRRREDAAAFGRLPQEPPRRDRLGRRPRRHRASGELGSQEGPPRGQARPLPAGAPASSPPAALRTPPDIPSSGTAGRGPARPTRPACSPRPPPPIASARSSRPAPPAPVRLTPYRPARPTARPHRSPGMRRLRRFTYATSRTAAPRSPAVPQPCRSIVPSVALLRRENVSLA
jgi:hypothetical protein